MGRKKLPAAVETQVLTLSKRRCAICFGISSNIDEQRGQIAHLDGDPNNNSVGNLVYLCLDHHDQYDSKTSQSKNYTKEEIKMYREQLYMYNRRNNVMKKSKEEIQILGKYLNCYQNLFEFLFTHGRESAYIFDDDPFILLKDLISNWFCSRYKCNDEEIQQYQNIIYENLADIYNNILNKYEYVSTERGIIFQWQNDQENNARFDSIRDEMERYINKIKKAWDELKSFLA
jgi:hypothetical protein